MRELEIRIAGTVLNDYGNLLAYSTNNSMHSCEEWASKNLLAWERAKELGCKVIQTVVLEVGTEEEMIAAIKRFCKV